MYWARSYQPGPGGSGSGSFGGVFVAVGDGRGAGAERGQGVEEDAAPFDVVVDKPVVDLVVLKLLRGLSPVNGYPGEVDVPLT